MSWSEQVFRYCERGIDPAFWAEPLNAASNAAFLIGAGWALHRIRLTYRGRPALAETALALLVAVIGVGSFLFHTFATRWAMVADVVPIGVFMLAYLVYALRVLLRAGWVVTAAGVIVFVLALRFAGDVQCARSGLIGIAAASRGPCLNGTLGYLPAWLAMVGVGGILRWRGEDSAPLVLTAAGIFLISMVLRTIDIEACGLTRAAGRALGTHFLWHLANAATLILLLSAALLTREKSLRDGPGQRERQPL